MHIWGHPQPKKSLRSLCIRSSAFASVLCLPDIPRRGLLSLHYQASPTQHYCTALVQKKRVQIFIVYYKKGVSNTISVLEYDQETQSYQLKCDKDRKCAEFSRRSRFFHRDGSEADHCIAWPEGIAQIKIALTQ